MAVTMNVHEVNVTVTSGLSQLYEAERRTIGTEVSPTRERTMRVVSQRFERLKTQKEGSGAGPNGIDRQSG